MRFLELRIPPVVVSLLLGGLMTATSRLAPAFNCVVPAGPIIAAGLTVAGLVIAGLAVVSFRRARTTVNPLQPAAASRLVVSGIYHWTRNPMYLGMLLVLLGWGVLLAHGPALGLALAFVPLMDRLQIGPEEKTLAASFGPAFAAYQSTVRRWL